MITSFPPADKEGVIPVESPTVPKAEMASNRSSTKFIAPSR
jgi:hypothetical protein